MLTIKSRINNVALNCSAIVGGIIPVDFSSLVIVELYPDIKVLSDDVDAKSFTRLLSILTDVRKCTARHNYSKIALVELVKDLFLANCSLDDLKDVISDSVFFQYPDDLFSPMIFKSVSSNPPQLRINYGDEEYVHKETTNSKRIKEHKEDVGMDDTTKETINTLAKRLPVKDYVWQANINYNLYLDIKSVVESVFKKYSGKIIMSALANTELAIVLKYYIAEWYKREYNNTAIFPSIPSDISEKLVKQFKIPHSPVKVKTMFQSCLRAQGGLPAFYLLELIKRDKTSTLLDNLTSLFDTDDSRDYDATEILFNDKTINTSESIQALIPDLQAKLFPYDKDDLVNSLSSWTFGDFIEKLEAGFERNKQRKFTIEYRFWIMPGFAEKLTTCIRFRPDATGMGRNYAISEERLSTWGINIDDLNQFALMFECDGHQHTLPYFKCLNQDWVPFKCENVVATDFPLFKDIKVSIEQTQLPSITHQSRNKGYIQLFSEDHRLWTSRGKCGRYSLVIFDPSRWNSSEAKSINGSAFEYIELVDGKCILTNNNSNLTITFYNAEGSLLVKPKGLHFQDPFFINNIGEQFPCILQDGETTVYAVDPSGFEVGILKGTAEVGWLEDKEYDTQIYDFKSSRFKKLESIDLRGYQILRFRDKYYGKSAEIACFFVPTKATITRAFNKNSKEGNIKLDGLNDFTVVHKDTELSRDSIYCKYGNTQEESCFKLAIVDDRNNKLSLDIVMPYDCTDILFKDDSGQFFIKDSPSVPAKLANHYVHRIFSSGGLQLLDISEEKRYEIYDFIHRTVLSNGNEQKIPITKFDNSAKISLYSKLLQRDNQHKYIVDSGKSLTEDRDLKFFFVPIDDGEPVELSLKTIDNNNTTKKYLLLDIPSILDDTAGIIIQSLKGLNPKEYYRAAYKPSSKEQDGITNNEKERRRDENKRKYSNLFYSEKPDFQIALRAFDLALDLNCYFGWFDELKVLCSYEQSFAKRMVEFFKQYIDVKIRRHETMEYDGLWSLAGEFMFDWMLFPAEHWRTLAKKGLYSDYIRKLFCARPGLQGAARHQTAEIYSLITSDRTFGFKKSNKSFVNKIAQCIRGSRLDIAQIKPINDKIKKTDSFLTRQEKIATFKKMTDFDTLFEIHQLLNQKDK